jgi:hypothetical protein
MTAERALAMEHDGGMPYVQRYGIGTRTMKPSIALAEHRDQVSAIP